MNWLRSILGLNDQPSIGLSKEIAEAGVRNKQAFEKLQQAVSADPVLITVHKIVAEMPQ